MDSTCHDAQETPDHNNKIWISIFSDVLEAPVNHGQVIVATDPDISADAVPGK